MVESENGQAGHHDALMNLSRMFATVATNPSRVTTVAFCWLLVGLRTLKIFGEVI